MAKSFDRHHAQCAERMRFRKDSRHGPSLDDMAFKLGRLAVYVGNDEADVEVALAQGLTLEGGVHFSNGEHDVGILLMKSAYDPRQQS